VPPTTAYRKVADSLRAAIRGHDDGEGRRLPTEAELARAHGVSRQTVRRAYQELVADGLVKRTAGRGTFSLPQGQYLRSFGSIEDLLALSVDTALEVVDPLELVSDTNAWSDLGLHTSETYRISFRRLHDSLAFCFTTVYLPVDMGLRLRNISWLRRRGSTSRDTILGLLERTLNVPVLGAKQTVSAVLPQLRIAQLIECPPGRPVIRIDRLYFDENGRTVELATNFFNPDRYTYRLEIRRLRG
jgi:GntR family transcriptional regulator